jgi:hypothetical protein
MSSVSTVEELCNLALDAISYPRSIGSIYQGTKEARVALRLYAQTRDDLLAGKDWIFARQTVALSVLKVAPVGGYSTVPWTTAYPPLPWIFEYAYPAACIQVRALRPTPAVIPEFMPRPYNFVLGNDTATGQKVILTNLINAQAVITGQITDPSQMDPKFITALVDALALQFQKALVPAEPAVRDRAAEAGNAENAADTRRG